MLALRTPQWGPGCRSAAGRLRVAGELVARAILVVAVSTLFTFMTIGTSQACPIGNNSTVRVGQIAQSVPAVAEQHAVRAAEGMVKLAIQSTACRANGSGSGYRHSAGCGGSCCPACHSPAVTAGWPAAQDPALHFDFPPLHAPLPSTELDALFRPPRAAL
jgi:hypothetical protein